MKNSDKKREYVDMDGVLCNFYKAAKQALTENPNQKYPQSQWGFFLKLEEIPGAIEGFRKLEEKYDLLKHCCSCFSSKILVALIWRPS